MENARYKYYKYLNSTYCRFLYNEPTKKYSPIGEVYNYEQNNWITSIDTIRIMLSGEAHEISVNDVEQMLKLKDIK